MIKRSLSLLLALLLLCSAALAENSPAGMEGYIAHYYTATPIGSSFDVYDVPAAFRQILTLTLAKGETLKVLERAHDENGQLWAYCWLPDDTVAWVPSEQLTFSDSMHEHRYAEAVTYGVQATAYVNESGAAVYREQTPISSIIGTIPGGTEITVLFGEGGMSTVFWNGLTGYVAHRDLTLGFALSSNWRSELPADAPSIPTPAPGEEFSYIARKEAHDRAVAALKQVNASFDPAAYTAIFKVAMSEGGVEGPLYSFIFLDEAGNPRFVAYIAALTGETLLAADYSDFQFGQGAEDIATAQPHTTPKPTQAPGEISESQARQIADSALTAAYASFAQYSFTQVRVSRSNGKPGFKGPFYQFDYCTNIGVQYIAMVHCVTGQVIHTVDHGDSTLTEIDYDAPEPTATPEPIPEEQATLSQSECRSIGSRYLASKYPAFSGADFSRVSHRYATEDAYFGTPYHQFDYFVRVGDRDDLAFSVIVNAITGEIEYSFGDLPGEANG